MRRAAALQLPVLAHHLLRPVRHHQYGGHAKSMRHDQIARQILEHRGFRRIDIVPFEKAAIGLRRRFRLQLGGDDVEHGLEMMAEAEPLQHLAGMIGRAVGQDQLAARQPFDRRTHRRIGLERRVIDLMDVSEIVVGGDAVFGHHAAHAGAEALVVVLLDAPGFDRVDLEELADVFADPGIDLLPEVDVMRIERVVQIEHPGVDVAEAALRPFVARCSLVNQRSRALIGEKLEQHRVWGLAVDDDDALTPCSSA